MSGGAGAPPDVMGIGRRGTQSATCSLVPTAQSLTLKMELYAPQLLLQLNGHSNQCGRLCAQRGNLLYVDVYISAACVLVYLRS
jgi:hypothetical protein